MTDISKRLEQTLRSAISNSPILPVKVDDGILVGDAKIVSEGAVKHVYYKGHLVYKEISLNAVAIKLANLLAKRQSTVTADKVYRADQEYGRWYIDSQMLRSQYQRAEANLDFDRAEILWTKYCASRDRAVVAKNHAQGLAAI
jgi:hypothetical protein